MEGCDQEENTKVVNDTIGAPQVGMKFRTIDEVKSFYEIYGLSQGFSVCTRSSGKSWSRCDLVTYIILACSHYGSHKKKITENVPEDKRRRNTSTMRGDCPAQMNIIRDKKTFEWIVSGFKKEHNHEFVSPSKRVYLKVNRKMPEVAKNMVEIFQRENIPVHKVANKFIITDKRECVSQQQANATRLGQLCQEATQLAYVASQSDEGFKIYLDGIRALSEQISQIKITTVDNDVAPINPPTTQPPQPLLDPHVSQTKGRNKVEKGKKKKLEDARMKHPIEIAKENPGRTCKYCGVKVHGHDSRNCPQKVAEMDKFSQVQDKNNEMIIWG